MPLTQTFNMPHMLLGSALYACPYFIKARYSMSYSNLMKSELYVHIIQRLRETK